MDQSFQTQMPPQQNPPKNWLVESILVTLFCCLPFGIVGIVFAAQVNSKFAAGDYAGALKASQDAGKWTKIGFWIGIVAVAAAILLTFFLELQYGKAASWINSSALRVFPFFIFLGGRALVLC